MASRPEKAHAGHVMSPAKSYPANLANKDENFLKLQRKKPCNTVKFFAFLYRASSDVTSP